jgi:hypothetical protein
MEIIKTSEIVVESIINKFETKTNENNNISDIILQNFEDNEDVKELESDVKNEKKVAFKTPLFAVSNNKKKNKKKKKNVEEKDLSMRTLAEIINDSESGIPIPNKNKSKLDIIKSTKKKNTIISEKTLSQYGSNISKAQDKSLLRQKTTNDGENYNKFFKPKIVLDAEGKMKIEKPNIAEAAKKLNEEINKNTISIVEFDTPHTKVTSLSFRKNTHVDKWKKEETILFYKALECFGTDFSFLEMVLKPRKRNEIKNKYRKEEKANPEMIDSALKKFDTTKMLKLLSILKKIKEGEKIQSERNRKRKRSDIPSEEIDFKNILLGSEGGELREEDLNLELKEISDDKDDKEQIEEEFDEEKTISQHIEESEEENDEIGKPEVNNVEKPKDGLKINNNIIQIEKPPESEEDQKDDFAAGILKNFE